MNRIIQLTLILPLIMLLSCNSKTESPKDMGDNPFFMEYGTPYNIPPFEKIKLAHYMPAFNEAMRLHAIEIETIVNNSESPDFKNTIEALDYSGLMLNEVRGVFYNMLSSNTNDSLQNLATEVAPLLSQHEDNILLNAELFKRVKTVYDAKSNLSLNTEQTRLLDETYKRFVRGGAGLDAKQQEALRTINQELSTLALKFGENILKETNSFKLVIDKKEDLVGLPQSIIDGGAETAKEAGMEGKWVFTLHNPSVMPFLQYAAKRELREKIWNAYTNRGNNSNEFDNKDNIKKIIDLRIKRANLLGYKSYADYVLAENMAKNAANVYNLLNKLWEPAIKVAANEAKEMQAMIDAEGGKFKLAPWDWRYYAEKVRKAKYNLDDEELRPYFELENVKKGVFMTVNKLWGLNFIEKTDVPKYHTDAVCYEVQDKEGKYLGILFMDFHPRDSKRGGAWMNNYREQNIREGKDVRPVITVVCNFSKPTADMPALLTLDEVSTFFHEFGHALHGMLSQCTYPSLAGTNVSRDFVELPSQIMENWATTEEVLNLYAKHYKTGATIPADLVNKMKESKFFNQGFETIEYLAASTLDMDYHVLTENTLTDVLAFENESMQKLGLMPEIISRYKSTYFNHIFSGGYATGYYSYIWAQVLDADAFDAFKQNGIFDPKSAEAFRVNILEKGGTEDAMELYKKFRGAEPDIKALIKRKGLDKV